MLKLSCTRNNLDMTKKIFILIKKCYICIMYSLSEENYLKAIYHLELDLAGPVSTNAIAEKMETKASSVTDMLKKLDAKELLDYVKYKGASLTPTGQVAAVKVIRKHRLWEVFLVDQLGFAWHEVHQIAEQLEHIQSEQLIDKLDNFLGEPAFDPHGDPIPDKHGNFKKLQKRLLAKVAEGVQGVCVGVKESNDEFLQYLSRNHIGIGTTIRVENKEPFDGSMQIIAAGKPIFISSEVANNIYVNIN